MGYVGKVEGATAREHKMGCASRMLLVYLQSIGRVGDING
jgi:hypothetical protein